MPPGLDPRDAEIARLREENARIQAEAARLQASAAPAAAPPAHVWHVRGCPRPLTQAAARGRRRRAAGDRATTTSPGTRRRSLHRRPPRRRPTAAPVGERVRALRAQAAAALAAPAPLAPVPTMGGAWVCGGVHLREPEPERLVWRPAQHGAPGRGLIRVRRACGASARVRAGMLIIIRRGGSCAPNRRCLRKRGTHPLRNAAL